MKLNCQKVSFILLFKFLSSSIQNNVIRIENWPNICPSSNRTVFGQSGHLNWAVQLDRLNQDGHFSSKWTALFLSSFFHHFDFRILAFIFWRKIIFGPKSKMWPKKWLILNSRGFWEIFFWFIVRVKRKLIGSTK